MLLSGVAVAACGAGEIQVVTVTCDEITADLASRRADMITTPSGLMYEELAEGSGKAAEAGDHVYTHYVLCSPDGQELDSSLAPDRGVPLDFDLDAREMIQGFDEGVQGMKVGGRRILVLPAELAYGQQGRPGIPPGAELIFHVQLMSIGTPE
jgi:FKBP-type peptidyl-prolyl cis-trans isomerase